MKKESFAQLDIIKKNVEFNYKYFRKKLKPTTKMLVLLKANAYGHGDYEFAKIVEKLGADYLAVAHPTEGIELRERGIVSKPIIVLTTGTDHYKELISYRLEPAIPNISSLKKFKSIMNEMKIESYPVHIKIDTGMHRLGFMEKELDELIKYLKKNRQIKVQSIYSHLAAADEKEFDKFTISQIELFDRLAPQIDNAIGYHPLHHILNSAGIERFSKYQKDMVRLGIGIYGISALGADKLKPAATLKCRILQIKELDNLNETVGYGRKGIINKKTKIAILPIGYADGIDRRLGCGNFKFFLNGKMVPTIGVVCMDMFMLDVTNANAKVGDLVTIFGDKPHITALSNYLQTIPYEVFASIDGRIKRVII